MSLRRPDVWCKGCFGEVVGGQCVQCGGGQNPPMPQTTKERQEALRARRLMLGMTEVRGVYLPPALHAELKAHARKLGERVSANAPAQREIDEQSMRKKTGEER
jgi:hypothetical protein